jgi:uncharacterized protein
VISIEKPKDRDFIETTEGYLFCVVGYLHPPDGYTAYLKYVPSQTGKWSRGKTRYTRSIPYYQVSQVENTYDFLKKQHSEYILQCPVRNIEVSWVPKHKVQTYYKPRERIQEIKNLGPKDSLEQKLIKLSKLLEETANIENSLGVTGSILTKTHNPAFSDIDLTVYGKNNSNLVKMAILDLKEDSSEIKGPIDQERDVWVKNRLNNYGLETQDLDKISGKRWNYGYYGEVYFSIHPTRDDGEISETYGDNIYTRIGQVTGTATVMDSSESIYLPASYRISRCEMEGVTEIVSFEGLYCNVFAKGDRVQFNGILEEVSGKNPHKRVIIGGAGSPDSYIKWV